MKTVLAAAALSLCLAFAGHAAELRPMSDLSRLPPGCIRHSVSRVSDTSDGRAIALGCARFLATSRVVQPRRFVHT